jgi:hypothetical protein
MTDDQPLRHSLDSGWVAGQWLHGECHRRHPYYGKTSIAI